MGQLFAETCFSRQGYSWLARLFDLCNWGSTIFQECLKCNFEIRKIPCSVTMAEVLRSFKGYYSFFQSWKSWKCYPNKIHNIALTSIMLPLNSFWPTPTTISTMLCFNLFFLTRLFMISVKWRLFDLSDWAIQGAIFPECLIGNAKIKYTSSYVTIAGSCRTFI